MRKSFPWVSFPRMPARPNCCDGSVPYPPLPSKPTSPTASRRPREPCKALFRTNCTGKWMWRSTCKPWNYPEKCPENGPETIFRIPETFGEVISSISARPLVGAAGELPTGNREFVYCPRKFERNAVARFSSQSPINFKYQLVSKILMHRYELNLGQIHVLQLRLAPHLM